MSLELKKITKCYGRKTVLDDLDLTLEEGKIYGLVGRNGAGKTTMLSIASAQNPATKGEILLDGEKVWENQKVLNRICFSREMVNAANNITSALKVKEYLKMAEILFPYWDKEMADRLVEEFELDEKQKIMKLSKGMQSMVTIIVALDEYSESGRTFVISTHIIEEAAEVFEEVIFLNKGKIMLKENTEELLDRCIHISGRAEDVDEIMKGKRAFHQEKLGRSKGITLMLDKGEVFDKKGKDVEVSPLNLQDVFVALCGKEEKL